MHRQALSVNPPAPLPSYPPRPLARTRPRTRWRPPSRLDRAAAIAFSPVLTLRALDRLILAVLLHRIGAAFGETAITHAELARAVGASISGVRGALRRLVAHPANVLAIDASEPAHPRYIVTCEGWGALLCGRALDPALGELDALTTHERAALAVVLLHTGPLGVAWPSDDRIAALAGMSERAVGRALGQLRARGIVEATRIAPGGRLPGGQTARSWCRLLTEGKGCPQLELVPASAPKRDDDPVSWGGHPCFLGRSPLSPEAEERIPRTDPKNEEAARDPLGATSSEVAATHPDVEPLLRELCDRLELDTPGPDADAIVARRLDEGATVRDLRDAIAGIAATPWRMAKRERRWVKSTMRARDRFLGFVELGREVRGELRSLRDEEARRVRAKKAAEAAIAESYKVVPAVEVDLTFSRRQAALVGAFLDHLAPPLAWGGRA